METTKVTKLSIDDVIDEVSQGVYSLPWPEDAPRFKIRALLKYCEEKGKNTEDLTEQELREFKV
ncbi:MAG: hypothetical protein ACOY35_04445 [Bacillota bacterium]